jgi:DNA-binding NarL/FixJ family response regulator
MDALHVFIVAGDPLVRTGLASLLDDGSAARVVGQGAPGEDLSGALAAAQPDVVVWDFGSDSPAAPDQIVAVDPSMPVVALIGRETDAAEAFAAGARGVLLRNIEAGSLLTALHGVAGGLLVLDPALTSATVPARDRESPPSVEELTPREVEVLQLLAEGLPNKQVARRLGLSEHTVKFHVNAILSKLDAHSRTEAVTRAVRLGLIIL